MNLTDMEVSAVVQRENWWVIGFDFRLKTWLNPQASTQLAALEAWDWVLKVDADNREINIAFILKIKRPSETLIDLNISWLLGEYHLQEIISSLLFRAVLWTQYIFSDYL